jgi:phosphomannomutase
MGEHLKISISGVRGVVGEPDGLTPELVAGFGAAYGSFCKGGPILVGSDTRPTGPLVRQALFAGLASAGCDVIDAGILPTPTVLFLVRQWKMAGGVVVTASHNPAQWNALKLSHADGRFLNDKEGSEVIATFEQKRAAYASWDRIGAVRTLDNRKAFALHAKKILQSVDASAIRRKKFKVALDPVNGAGASLAKLFLEELGCRVVSINDIPDGKFGRKAEPLPENLGGLRGLVKKSGAQVGFALDPDADRLAMVDETGTPLGEEYTLALCTDHILRKTPGPVVINEATSLATELTALRRKCVVHRTKIGEVNVTMKMLAEKAVIGGEGNGGVIWPKIGLGRDSFSGMALVLEDMAKTGQKISSLKKSLPQYEIVKTVVKTERIDIKAITKSLQRLFPSGKIRTLDGLKVVLPEAWVIVRPSNTEPVVRVIAEAKDRKKALALCETVRKELG